MTNLADREASGIECPTPDKLLFKSMTTARRHAVKITREQYDRYRIPFPFYGYRCVCGWVHLTSMRKSSRGTRNVLLARMKAPRLLVERALERGAA